ncbi:MAG: hypothetical protein ABIR78_10490 [Ferruginibacter sp.]
MEIKPFFYTCILFVLIACNHNIIVAKNYKEKITAHKLIAILPFNMTLNLTEAQQKILDQKDQGILRQTLSLDLQKNLYFRVLKYLKKNSISVQVQDLEETLSRLSSNNIRFNDLHNPNKTALLKILGVDAILDPEMTITQHGVSFSAIGPLFIPAAGVAIVESRNLYIDFSVSVKDLSTDTALWNYKKGDWYMAKNKVKKNKKEVSNDFLEALFLNVDDIFKAFILKSPYLKK